MKTQPGKSLAEVFDRRALEQIIKACRFNAHVLRDDYEGHVLHASGDTAAFERAADALEEILK